MFQHNTSFLLLVFEATDLRIIGLMNFWMSAKVKLLARWRVALVTSGRPTFLSWSWTAQGRVSGLIRQEALVRILPRRQMFQKKGWLFVCRKLITPNSIQEHKKGCLDKHNVHTAPGYALELRGRESSPFHKGTHWVGWVWDFMSVEEYTCTVSDLDLWGTSSCKQQHLCSWMDWRCSWGFCDENEQSLCQYYSHV